MNIKELAVKLKDIFDDAENIVIRVMDDKNKNQVMNVKLKYIDSCLKNFNVCNIDMRSNYNSNVVVICHLSEDTKDNFNLSKEKINELGLYNAVLYKGEQYHIVNSCYDDNGDILYRIANSKDNDKCTIDELRVISLCNSTTVCYHRRDNTWEKVDDIINYNDDSDTYNIQVSGADLCGVSPEDLLFLPAKKSIEGELE